MTVECPGCNTRFPVDHRKVPDGGVHARCSVCSEVFFVEVEAPEAELVPAFLPEDETTDVGMELPEAEVLEEEPEPVLEAPEEEEEAEPAFEAPEAVEEEAEPAFETPEAVEEEEAEPAFETPEAVEEEPEPVFEAPEAVEEAAEPAFEAPETGGEEEGLPFELPEIVTEERTFGDEPPTFGDGETTFPMDSPTLDTHVEVDEDTAPTFGDPTPTIEFTDIPGPDVSAPDETAWQEKEPYPEAPEPQGDEPQPTFEAPAPPFDEPEAVFEPPESVVEGPPSTVETPEPMPPLPTPHFGRRDPREKAQRLARVLVSDIILYNPDRHQRALELGSLKEEFEDEIQKSWNEYVDQVGDEIANSTNFFNEALNEILAKGQPMF